MASARIPIINVGGKQYAHPEKTIKSLSTMLWRVGKCLSRRCLCTVIHTHIQTQTHLIPTPKLSMTPGSTRTNDNNERHRCASGTTSQRGAHRSWQWQINTRCLIIMAGPIFIRRNSWRAIVVRIHFESVRTPHNMPPLSLCGIAEINRIQCAYCTESCRNRRVRVNVRVPCARHIVWTSCVNGIAGQ